ncbi:MAG: hypothetical protein AB7V06_28150 [Candidatus Obscuribacterales bacterium]
MEAKEENANDDSLVDNAPSTIEIQDANGGGKSPKKSIQEPDTEKGPQVKAEDESDYQDFIRLLIMAAGGAVGGLATHVLDIRGLPGIKQNIEYPLQYSLSQDILGGVIASLIGLALFITIKKAAEDRFLTFSTAMLLGAFWPLVFIGGYNYVVEKLKLEKKQIAHGQSKAVEESAQKLTSGAGREVSLDEFVAGIVKAVQLLSTSTDQDSTHALRRSIEEGSAALSKQYGRRPARVANLTRRVIEEAIERRELPIARQYRDSLYNEALKTDTVAEAYGALMGVGSHFLESDPTFAIEAKVMAANLAVQTRYGPKIDEAKATLKSADNFYAGINDTKKMSEMDQLLAKAQLLKPDAVAKEIQLTPNDSEQAVTLHSDSAPSNEPTETFKPANTSPPEIPIIPPEERLRSSLNQVVNQPNLASKPTALMTIKSELDSLISEAPNQDLLELRGHTMLFLAATQQGYRRLYAEKAKRDFDESFNMGNRSGKLFLGRGICLYYLWHLSEAEKQLDLAINRLNGADKRYAYYYKALAQKENNNDYEGAIASLDDAILLDPKFGDAYLLRARLKKLLSSSFSADDIMRDERLAKTFGFSRPYRYSL